MKWQGSKLYQFVRTLSLVPALALMGLLGAGLTWGLVQSFGYFPALGLEEWTLRYYQAIFADPRLRESLVFSFKVATSSALLSLLVGILLSALVLAFRQSKHHLLHLTIGIPHIVMAFLVRGLFAQVGLFSRLAGSLGWIQQAGDFPLLIQDPQGWGIILAYVLKQAPYVMSVTYILLQRADTAYYDLGRSLGAKPGQIFCRITLPQTRQALFSAFLILVAFDFGAYELPFLLGATLPRMLAVQSQLAFSETDLALRPQAMAYTMLLALCGLLIVLASLLLYRLLWRSNRPISSDGAQVNETTPPLSRPPASIGRKLVYGLALAWPILSLLVLMVYAFFRRWPWPDLLPHQPSLQAFAQLFKGQNLHILGFSLRLSLLAALLATLIALPVAKLLARGSFRGRKLLEAIFLLPLLVPSTSYYIGLHVLFIQWGIQDSVLAVLLAHAIVILPYCVFSLAAFWQPFADYYTTAGCSLGASRWQAFWRIDLPLLAPGLAAVLGLGFIISFGQYFLTLMVGGGRVKTFALILVPYMTSSNRALAAASSLVFVIICGVIYSLCRLHLGVRRKINLRQKGLL